MDNLKKYKRAVTFAREYGYSKTWITKKIKAGELTGVQIDGLEFVVLDDKAINFKKKGE